VSTRTYYMDDCTIVVPAGPRDRTVNALEWELENGDKLALVIQREPLPVITPGAPVSLSAYVATQTADLPSQLAGFRLEREEATAAGAPFEIERRAFRWKREQNVLYHHQAYVRVGDGVVVLTVTGKALHRDAIDHVLDQALADLHVRGD
jgi:hypothetical protein